MAPKDRQHLQKSGIKMPRNFVFRLVILGLPLLILFLMVTGRGLAQESNRAGIVVRLSESESLSRCVSFTEEDISGLELLERSGLVTDIRTEGMGSLVCSINDTGCPSNDCFCQCRGGGECIYWSYWQESEQGWQYAKLGASSYRVGAGELDGWSWGPGSLTEAIAPADLTFEQICTDSIIDASPVSSQESEQRVDTGALVLFVLLVAVLGVIALIVFRRRATQ